MKNDKSTHFFDKFHTKGLKSANLCYNSAFLNYHRRFEMNKAEFADLVKEVGEFNTKKEAERAISAFVAAVEKALSKKESIELVGFGKFETVFQKGKSGLVPGTNKKYTTHDKYVPKFKAGKALKDAVAAAKKGKK